MKTFATLALAATVSANYCYRTGNCSGKSRECYSLPRSVLGIDTCYPDSTAEAAEITDSLKAVRTEEIKEEIAKAGYSDFAGRMFRDKKYNYEWAHNGNGELVVVRTGGGEGRTQFNR